MSRRQRRPSIPVAHGLQRRPADSSERPHVPPVLRVGGAWAWRAIVIAVAVVGIGYAVSPLSTMVISLLVALILAVLLEPLASFLRRKARFPRILASATTILIAIAAVAGALTFAGQSIVSQLPLLRDSALAGWNQLLDMLSNNTQLELTAESLQQATNEAVAWLQSNAQDLLSGALSIGSTVLDVLLGVLIALFSLLFFLKDGRRIWQWVVRLFPAQAREPINEAGIRAWITLGEYARAQIIVALIDAIGIGLGAYFLGLPFVIPIAVIVFLSSFIPVLGAWISGALAVLVALVTVGFTEAVIMLVIVLLVQQLESNVVSPLLMSNAVSLHPLVTFLAVLAGSTLFGLAGALFAVPLCAMVNAVVLYLTGHDKTPELMTDWDRPGGPPGVLLPSITESYRLATKEHPRLTDEELDARTIEMAGGRDAVPVPTPADAHVAAVQDQEMARDVHEGPQLPDAPDKVDTASRDQVEGFDPADAFDSHGSSAAGLHDGADGKRKRGAD